MEGMVNNDVDAAFANHHYRSGEGTRDIAARHRLATLPPGGQGRLSA